MKINKNKFNIILLTVFTLVMLSSCEQPEDRIIVSVNTTNDLLINNLWKLEDFKIEVRNEDIPPPLLFSNTSTVISSGIFDLDDMVLDPSEMREYIVQFTNDRKIITNGGQLDILGNEVGSYFVFNDKTIRISAEENLNYRYFYDEQTSELALTVSAEDASRLVQKVTDKVVDAIAKDSPGPIGSIMSDLLFNNEKLQTLINGIVVDAISGKLEFINEINPDLLAEQLAEKIILALQNIEWEPLLTDLIKDQLEGISNIDVDAVAQAISNEVAGLINEKLTVDAINSFVLPYIIDISTKPEQVANSIATLVVNLFSQVFNEDNLQPLVSSAWQKFTELSPEQVGIISDTLTSVVEDVFFNKENVAGLITPFTTRIDETSLFQLGNLATETTDAIKGLVSVLNDRIPDLNLSPDYESMQNTIRLAFVAAKPIISISGPEQVASDVAGLLLSQFLTSEVISNTFDSAISVLQSIDSEAAGTTLAQWLVNLEDDISPVLFVYIRDFLSPIIDNLDPESTALNIATALNSFIELNITPENVYDLIFPFLEEVTKINAEVVANFLANIIINLDIIKDNLTEEGIAAILLPILESVQETNVDNLVQNLIIALVNSDIFQEEITQERVRLIISLLIYKSYWDNVLIANNFEEAVIILSHE